MDFSAHGDTPRNGARAREALAAAPDRDEEVSAEPLGGGRLLSAISTRFVKLLREHYWRGPVNAKTYAFDDIVLVVLRGSGFTQLEKTLMTNGRSKRVAAIRREFQKIMAKRFTEAIEELTGRTDK